MVNLCIKDENERISEEFLEFLLCFSGVSLHTIGKTRLSENVRFWSRFGTLEKCDQ